MWTTSCYVASMALAACGNGRLEPWESCDDGNRDDGDACTNECQPRCGADPTVDVLLIVDDSPCEVSEKLRAALPSLVTGLWKVRPGAELRIGIVFGDQNYSYSPSWITVAREIYVPLCGKWKKACTDPDPWPPGADAMRPISSLDDLTSLACLLQHSSGRLNPVPLCALSLFVSGDCFVEENCPGPPRTLATIVASDFDDCSVLYPPFGCSLLFGLQAAAICDWDRLAMIPVEPAVDAALETFGTSFFFAGLIGLNDDGESPGPPVLPLDESPWWDRRVICTSSTGMTEATPAPRLLSFAELVPGPQSYVGSICDDSFEEHFYEIGRRLGYLTSPCPE